MFVTLETDIANMNIIMRPNIFEVYRRIVLGGHMLSARGILQKEGEVVHLVDRKIYDLSKMLAGAPN